MAHHRHGVPTVVIGKHTIADGRFLMAIPVIVNSRCYILGYVNSRCYILVTVSILDVTLVTVSILDVTLVTVSILDVTLVTVSILDVTSVTQSIAPQFWDKGGLLEKYISWRTHSCNTLCFWTILSSDLASGPFSQSIVYGQKLHNLDLIVFSGYPSLSSRSVFGSYPSRLYCCPNLVVVSSTLDLSIYASAAHL